MVPTISAAAPESSLKELKARIQRDPAEPWPRLTRAEAYRQAAQWQLALEDYCQTLAVMPRNPYILLGMGACLAGQGEFDAALQQTQALLNEFRGGDFRVGI